MAICMHCVIKSKTVIKPISYIMKKILLLFYCALCIAQYTFSQTEYPIIEKEGKKYYEYIVNPGDGLFAIARKFGVKQSDLHEANENLSTDIKVGEKIFIPIKIETTNQSDDVAYTHVVEAKQTLYSISKMYNVNIDTLIALNPSAKTGIKTGETLIISKNKNFKPSTTQSEAVVETPVSTNHITHLVQKKETLYSISKKYNIAIHDLITLNPELKDGLKAGTEIIIKGDKKEQTEIENNVNNPQLANNVIDTVKTQLPATAPQQPTPNTPEIITTQPTTSNTINIAYLLPLIAENANDEKNTHRFVEFYRGAILALNNAKKDGLSANIYTYNLPKSTNKIDSVLHLLDNQKIDIVIGPAYSEQLNQVLAYTKKHNITTIVPFSGKIDSSYYYPKLIQFNPPQDSLFNTVLKNTFAHRNLQYILARFENCKNKGNVFVEELSQLLTENNKQFIDVTIKPELVDSIVSKITPDTTILVLGSSRINDVVPILDSLNHYQLPNLQIWGFEEWGENIIKKYPQTQYYSLFYSNETEEYKENYKNWFGVRKQTVGVKYDLLGYDLTMLALKGINTTDDTTLTLNSQISDIRFLQTKPKLEFIDNRWLNTNYYLLFWNNITIKNISNKE